MPTMLIEDRLGELLLRWDELRRQGCDETARQLCAECPELIEELARRMDAVRDVDSVLDIDETGELWKDRRHTSEVVSGNRQLPDSWRAAAEYRPQGHHAHGGLGQIVIAHQQELDRSVALKRIRPDKLHAKARDRFLREAIITARLQHPGIVPIYGLGQDGDGPFYTMPFIQGQTLHEAIKAVQSDDPSLSDPSRRGLKFRGLLQHFVTVCNTMAYAHDQGIVHRDLKPSNIMLGPYGETLVVDWGLAKAYRRDNSAGGSGADADTDAEADAPRPSPSPEGLTATGMVLGTPRYMSPEQARGQPAGPASDIFNLGLILYAILTGKPAFDDASLRAADALNAVHEAVIVPPRRRDPNLPRALEAVCLKALSARPEDRYGSARLLGDDISRWLADEPVSAWNEPWNFRWRRWLKRHRTAVTATAAALVAALILGGISIYSYQTQVRTETTAADAALARAEQIRTDALAAWGERLDATAWVRAEALAADAANRDSGRLSIGLHRRLQSLAANVKAEAEVARADAELLNNLAAVRAAKNDPSYNAPASYGRAFQKRGLSIDTADPAASATLLQSRPRQVAVGIVSYLDDWALLVRAKKDARDRADRLSTLARMLDPDPWRNSLRDAMDLADRTERKRAVLRLAEQSDVASQPSSTIALLAAVLREAGEPGEAVRLLEPARFRHPDVWIYQELGLSLRETRPPRREAALRAFTAATTLRPEMGIELAKELREAGQTPEAISVLEDLTRRQPEAVNFYWLAYMLGEQGRTAESAEMYKRALASGRTRVSSGTDDFDTHRRLGVSLMQLGDSPGAVRELREAILLKPDSASVHCYLGQALGNSGDLAGCIVEMREAVRLQPDFAAFRFNLGLALANRSDLAGAISEMREAIRLKPDLAAGHDALGCVLSNAHDLPGAIKAFREAIRLRPDFPQAHSNLGGALCDSGDLIGGMAEFREAIRLNPMFVPAHQNLGDLLLIKGDRAGAVAAFREVIRLNPKGPDAHCKLAHVLRDLGQFKEALTLMERGHELGTQTPGWTQPSAAWVKECRRELELGRKLSESERHQSQVAGTEAVSRQVEVRAARPLRQPAQELPARPFAP